MKQLLFCFLTFVFSCAVQNCAAEGEEPYDPIAIYLTWQEDPTTTMTLQWISLKDDIEDNIEYHAAHSSFWTGAQGEHHLIPGLPRYMLHRVELKELRPNTNYRFRIKKNGRIFKFQTMPTRQTDPITFIVGGDIYHDHLSNVLETNRVAAQTSPLFALLGGDLAYTGGGISFFSRLEASIFGNRSNRNIERWIEWLTAWKETMVTPDGRLIPLVPCIGNHDVEGSFGRKIADAQVFYTLFSFPGTKGYGTLDFGDYMSVIVLDSGHTHPVEGEQTKWLAKSLSERKDVTHKFALYHVPAYPSARSFYNKRCSTVRQNWVPIFETMGLTAAFENHDHAYKRTKLLRGNKVDPSGVLYMGDGAWGVTEVRTPDYNRWYLAKSSAARHFIKVTLNGKHRQFTAIDHTGKVIDEFGL